MTALRMALSEPVIPNDRNPNDRSVVVGVEE
jgi:hypothetical protein